MPFIRLISMLLIVVVSAGLTVWLGSTLSAATQTPWAGWGVLVAVTLVAYLAWRVVYDRTSTRGGDRPDGK
jgi:membrane protein implicated in regulation of membrane protease activity